MKIYANISLHEEHQEHTNTQPASQVPQVSRPQAAGRGEDHWSCRCQFHFTLGARRLPAERNQPVPAGSHLPHLGRRTLNRRTAHDPQRSSQERSYEAFARCRWPLNCFARIRSRGLGRSGVLVVDRPGERVLDEVIGESFVPACFESFDDLLGNIGPKPSRFFYVV